MKTLLHFILLSIITFSAYGEKRVGGIITQDTRWLAEDGPFILEKDLLIPRYIRLILSPGTKIMVELVPLQDTSIPQIDKIDEISVSIKIQGILSCIGKAEKKISISPQNVNASGYGWYGIIFDNADGNGNEIAHTFISGAYVALTAKTCSPNIYRSVFEYNHIGILIHGYGKALVSNSIIGFNMLAGIRIINANPSISNSIIISNKNNGIWCDGLSKVILENNCFFANNDGHFLECDPEFGILSKKNNHGDSTDYASNIFLDPIFSGSPADSLAAERDLNVPTDKSKVKNSIIADIINTIRSTPAKHNQEINTSRYMLSKYSRCIDSGNPGEHLKDKDGTRNDIGLYGGPEFISK